MKDEDKGHSPNLKEERNRNDLVLVCLFHLCVCKLVQAAFFWWRDVTKKDGNEVKQRTVTKIVLGKGKIW